MMTKSLDFPPESSKYVSGDKYQRIVETPYGMGILIRTRENNGAHPEPIVIYEVELIDRTKIKPNSNQEIRSHNSTNPNMLYTPIKYPSVSPVVGSVVLVNLTQSKRIRTESASFELNTQMRGKVVEIRDDDRETHVIKLSSWRLAGRSSVLCYVSAKECEVINPPPVYEMDVFEKVEYANDLKQMATSRFTSQDYSGALELFAKAVDAVRYVQHGSNSTNEVRADLIAVMITCSNNAGTCSSKKEDWERAGKFGRMALVLIEALEAKGSNCKIKKILNSDGIGDSQLFGTWKVKSLLLIAKSQMERYDTAKITNSFKKALEVISTYKKENDAMYKQLCMQEKDVKRIRIEFSKRSKSALEKERKRARAMFQKSPRVKSSLSLDKKSVKMPHNPPNSTKIKGDESSIITVDGVEIPASDNEYAETSADNEDEEDKYSESSFFKEHSEAILILSGIAVAWLAIKLVTKKK